MKNLGNKSTSWISHLHKHGWSIHDNSNRAVPVFKHKEYPNHQITVDTKAGTFEHLNNKTKEVINQQEKINKMGNHLEFFHKNAYHKEHK